MYICILYVFEITLNKKNIMATRIQRNEQLTSYIKGDKGVFNYDPFEVLAVQYYLIYFDKQRAYSIFRGKDNPLTPDMLVRQSAKFFGSDKIKLLLEVEKQNILNILTKCSNVYEMNTETGKKSPDSDKILEQTGNLDRDSAISIIENVINNNRSDSKTIKDLMPRLIELKQWNKEKTTENSNIVIYELPKKQ